MLNVPPPLLKQYKEYLRQRTVPTQKLPCKRRSKDTHPVMISIKKLFSTPYEKE